MTMGPSLREVLSQLASEGLTRFPEGERILPSTPPERSDSALPWYVKLFIGVSAWIAGILITVFFFTVGMIDEDVAHFWGLLFCGLAIALHRFRGNNIFLGQLSLALSLTGQALVILGVYPLVNFEIVSLALTIILLEAILIWLHQDLVLRFISTLVINIFILIVVFDLDILPALHIFIFVLGGVVLLVYSLESQLRISGLEEAVSPVASASAVVFLGILIMPLLEDYSLQWWLSAALLLILLLFLLLQIVSDLGYSLQNRAVLALVVGCVFLFIPAMRMPGILAALLVLLLGFWRSHRGLQGLAAVFLVFYIWAYYYSLEWSLLTKSVVLLGSGVLLLLLRYYFVQVVSRAGGKV